MLRQCLFQLDGLLRHFEPRVARQLARYDVTADMYATQWFMTLFGYCLPPAHLVRVWDVVLYQGLPGMMSVALALVKIQEAAILGARDFEEVLGALSAERLKGGGGGGGGRLRGARSPSPGELVAMAARYPRLGAHLASLEADYWAYVGN